ncbi:hypothetical protein JCM10449v2_002086 [Rhodotorula kratochvilovae]
MPRTSPIPTQRGSASPPPSPHSSSPSTPGDPASPATRHRFRGRTWRTKECDALRRAKEAHGEDWDAVKTAMEDEGYDDRTSNSLQAQWDKMIERAMGRSGGASTQTAPWTVDEDARLLALRERRDEKYADVLAAGRKPPQMSWLAEQRHFPGRARHDLGARFDVVKRSMQTRTNKERKDAVRKKADELLVAMRADDGETTGGAAPAGGASPAGLPSVKPFTLLPAGSPTAAAPAAPTSSSTAAASAPTTPAQVAAPPPPPSLPSSNVSSYVPGIAAHPAPSPATYTAAAVGEAYFPPLAPWPWLPSYPPFWPSYPSPVGQPAPALASMPAGAVPSVAAAAIAPQPGKKKRRGSRLPSLEVGRAKLRRITAILRGEMRERATEEEVEEPVAAGRPDAGQAARAESGEALRGEAEA